MKPMLKIIATKFIAKFTTLLYLGLLTVFQTVVEVKAFILETMAAAVIAKFSLMGLVAGIDAILEHPRYRALDKKTEFLHFAELKKDLKNTKKKYETALNEIVKDYKNSETNQNCDKLLNLLYLNNLIRDQSIELLKEIRERDPTYIRASDLINAEITFLESKKNSHQNDVFLDICLTFEQMLNNLHSIELFLFQKKLYTSSLEGLPGKVEDRMVLDISQEQSFLVNLPINLVPVITKCCQRQYDYNTENLNSNRDQITLSSIYQKNIEKLGILDKDNQLEGIKLLKTIAEEERDEGYRDDRVINTNNEGIENIVGISASDMRGVAISNIEFFLDTEQNYFTNKLNFNTDKINAHKQIFRINYNISDGADFQGTEFLGGVENDNFYLEKTAKQADNSSNSRALHREPEVEPEAEMKKISRNEKL